ncbi:MAG: hypothetical protein PUP93_28785 [Rhizonema sp. NSF051]|nr:hypothetical protein [Rhizonema sp. NSF051]
MVQCTNALVTIASVEINKLVTFYSEILGEQPAKYIQNVYAEFQFPGLQLAIFQPKETHLHEFENSTKSTMSLCLEVGNLEDALAYLTTLGYSPPGEIITASHGREIYAYDPDGNRLILHQAKNNETDFLATH